MILLVNGVYSYGPVKRGTYQVEKVLGELKTSDLFAMKIELF